MTSEDTIEKFFSYLKEWGTAGEQSENEFIRFCDNMSLHGSQTLGDAEANGATTAKALIEAASANDISTHKLIRWFDLVSRAGGAVPTNQPLPNGILDEEQYLDFEQKMVFTFWRSATHAAAVILGGDGY